MFLSTIYFRLTIHFPTVASIQGNSEPCTDSDGLDAMQRSQICPGTQIIYNCFHLQLQQMGGWLLKKNFVERKKQFHWRMLKNLQMNNIILLCVEYLCCDISCFFFSFCLRLAARLLRVQMSTYEGVDDEVGIILRSSKEISYHRLIVGQPSAYLDYSMLFFFA